jgi:prepilin-type N-terminal cleavage/methylation domain-containing protein
METNTPVQSKRDRGFTLVELLIVIVILGVLATVTVFAVRGITNQSKTSTCASDKKVLQVAIEAYVAQTGNVPTEVQLVPDYMVEPNKGYNISADGKGTAVADAAPAAGGFNTNGCT